MIRYQAIGICVFALSGCMGWPNYGGGGMDEMYRYQRSNEPTPIHMPQDTRDQRIAKNLDITRKKIDGARTSDAGKYHPSGMTKILIQWGRAARSYAGHMHDDAEADIEKLIEMMRQIDEKLQNSKSMEPPLPISIQ